MFIFCELGFLSGLIVPDKRGVEMKFTMEGLEGKDKQGHLGCAGFHILKQITLDWARLSV